MLPAGGPVGVAPRAGLGTPTKEKKGTAMAPTPDKAAADERLYESPAGTSFSARPAREADIPCLVAEPRGRGRRAGSIIVLDGSRLIRRIGRLVEKGDVDPASLPRIVGVDFDDPLSDCTPWWHPAFKEEAPDFGGGADRFLDAAVLPVARAELEGGGAGGPSAPLALLGYSLGGLLCLQALMRTGAFDEYLIASPSTWYPGFVNKLARTPVQKGPRVVIACGRDEGLDHPEPIRGIRQDTDRAVEALTAKLSSPPKLLVDDFDHHQGLTVRLKKLLAAY